MTVRYWIVVASRDHAKTGQNGGFVQACHGKKGPVSRMKAGDWVIMYSPRMEFRSAKHCQAFTAIGRFVNEQVYPFDMGNGFVPYRRDVEFQACYEVPIRPLIVSLGFISNKRHWGAAFRYGVLEIPESDFRLIADKMLVRPSSQAPGFNNGFTYRCQIAL